MNDTVECEIRSVDVAMQGLIKRSKAPCSIKVGSLWSGTRAFQVGGRCQVEKRL